MALFSKKTKETKKKSLKEEKVVSTAPSIKSGINLKHLLIPRITEKATFLAEKNVYVFNVAKSVSKGAVASAVKEQYKVTPIKVNVVRIMGKKVLAKGRTGRSADTKKVYVYLKAGDKIEIV